MRDQAVTAAALHAYKDALNQAPAFVKNKEAMAAHSYGVNYGHARALTIDTGLTACSELHYALNRVDFFTVKAMIEERCKFTTAAELSRELAAKWQAYFDDPARSAKANAEDDDRCARAEAHDYRKVEDCHR